MKKKVTVYTDDGGEETLSLPAKYEVCWRCQGRGVHDCWEGGVTQDQFDGDPDFGEDYLSGMYDTTCTECRGSNVLLEIDRAACSPEDLAKYDDHWEQAWALQAAYEAERRMGC
jgi:hypothetical protein